MILEVYLEGCVFEKKSKMIVGKSKIPYFIIKPMCTIGIDTHFYAYEKKKYPNTHLIGCYLSSLPYTTPTKAIELYR